MTLNCEEDDLILKNNKKSEKCEDVKNKIRDLDRRAEDIIRKKLTKIGQKSRSISLRDKGRDELTAEL